MNIYNVYYKYYNYQLTVCSELFNSIIESKSKTNIYSDLHYICGSVYILCIIKISVIKEKDRN